MHTVYFIVCKNKDIFVSFYQSDGFEGNVTLNHAIVMFIDALQRM